MARDTPHGLSSGLASLFSDIIKVLARLVVVLALGIGVTVAGLVIAATFRSGWWVCLGATFLAVAVHAVLMFIAVPPVALATASGEGVERLGLGRRILERALERAAESDGRWAQLTTPREFSADEIAALRRAFAGAQDEVAAARRGFVGRVVSWGRRRLFSAVFTAAMEGLRARPHADGSVRVPSLADLLASEIDERVASILRAGARRTATLAILADVLAAAVIIGAAGGFAGFTPETAAAAGTAP